MDVREAEKILEDNFNIREGTFMYLLHEKNTFSPTGFKQLFECIQALSARPEAEKSLGEGRMITFIHSKFLEELLWHFNGGEYLRDVPENINEYVEALGYCTDGYFGGYTMKLEDVFGQ